MRGPREFAAVLLVAAAAAAGDPPPAPPAPAAPLTVADFEDPGAAEAVDGFGSSFRRVEPPGGGASAALEWTFPARPTSAALYLDAGDLDLSPYALLRVRARLTGERPGLLRVRLENSRERYLEGAIRGVGAEWGTFDVRIDSMAPEGEFDPRRVAFVTFLVFDCGAGGYLVDDVQLLPEPPPAPPAPPAKSPPWAGSKRKEAVVASMDFESPGSEDFVEAFQSDCRRRAGEGKEGGAHLRWTLDPAARLCYFVLSGLPPDVTGVRSVRFRVRSEGGPAPDVELRLMNTIQDFLGASIGEVGPEWRTVELDLPAMRGMGRFDPRRVAWVGFLTFAPRAAVLLVDDLQFVAKPGGWRRSEEEEIASAFGKERAKQVKRIETPRFDVYTDSKAAVSKFPKALEACYGFVKEALGVGEMEEKLPVYIFQNPTLYVEFTVRSTGWTKEQAEDTAGHGSGRYFATYYQAPETPTVVHELTHSVFHRTEGPWGGSWFQEGVAVFVEHLWQKRSAAEDFAPRLRSGQYVPLRRFTAMQTLVAEKDVKGGAGTADSLYLQAGAFHEFLARGPYAPRWPPVRRELATTVREEGSGAAILERGLGARLEEIEKEWVKWGSDPPKK
ncbi:MAG: hypothetical protein L6R43_04060 [Planctomycetes bacterium]|nr:hypothetical protein [Planctomycetota bacterium]